MGDAEQHLDLDLIERELRLAGWGDSQRIGHVLLRALRSSAASSAQAVARVKALEVDIRGLLHESGDHECMEHAGGRKPGHSVCATLCPIWRRKFREVLDGR